MKKKNAAKSAVMQRIFRYSSIELADPGSDKSLDQVKDFYSAHYPELVNSKVKGPTVEGDKQIYRFEIINGTKG